MLINRNLSIYSLGILVVSFSFACKNPSPAPVEKQLLYYPGKNIYLDEENDYYYYSLDGGSTWDSLENDHPSASALGSAVPVTRSEGRVWNNNLLHLRTYKGNRLNIINEQTLLLAKEDSMDRIKPVAKPVPAPVKAIEEEAPKKGIKKFFNKIFGKKKNSNAEK